MLRVAVAELMARPGTPARVVLDEAIELARRYGSAESGGFVNGVLDRSRARLRPGELLMLRAILSDIHGNLEALEAVLADVGARRRGEHRSASATSSATAPRPTSASSGCARSSSAAVAGNHDLAACGRIRLGELQLRTRRGGALDRDGAHAASTATYLRVAAARGALARARCWCTPRRPSPRRGTTCCRPPRRAPRFDAFAEPLCLIGHSHYPGAFELDSGTAQVALHAATPEIRARARAAATW